MIPFEEIDARLEALGKDRVWLGENTPYSSDYLRTVLAPNSTRRTERVQKIISDAIEREESDRASAEQQIPGVFDVLVTPEQIDGAYRAAAALHIDDIAVFCREAIGFRADEINSGNVDPVTRLSHSPAAGNGLKSLPPPAISKQNNG